MTFDELFDEAERLNVVLTFDNARPSSPTLLSNEALFHLPLLAMLILLLAKSRTKPRVVELGQIVGECLQSSIGGFKGSSQHMGWSANLRVRTIKALTFLEVTQLVEVDATSKRIEATPHGRAVVEAAIKDATNLAIALQSMERAYRNICSERQIEMRLA